MTRAWTRTCTAFWVRRGRIHLMLSSLYLQDRVVAVMLAVRESWLSSVTPRFLAVWVGANTELSKVIVRLWVGEPFPGRKSSSVLSRLIFRWCAPLRDVSQTARDLCCYQCFRLGRGLVGCHKHSYGRKSHVSEWQSRESCCTERRGGGPGRNLEGPQ